MSSFSSSLDTSPIPTTSTSTPPSSSSAASIPKIWRNRSLERARHTIPTIPATELPLANFPFNATGARFSEDENAAYSETIAQASRVESPGTARVQGPLGPQHVLVLEDPAQRRHSHPHHWAPARPPSPYIRHVEPQEREAAELNAERRGKVIENAHYPIYRGYERTDFIRAVEEWIWRLENLRTDYKEEFYRQCNRYMRFKLCEYRKLLRRMERLVQGLTELLALLRTGKYESEIPSECSWLRLILNVWIKSAIKRFELVTMKDCRDYVLPSERRDVMVSMEVDIEVLAIGLKVGPLERVAGLLRCCMQRGWWWCECRHGSRRFRQATLVL